MADLGVKRLRNGKYNQRRKFAYGKGGLPALSCPYTPGSLTALLQSSASHHKTMNPGTAGLGQSNEACCYSRRSMGKRKGQPEQTAELQGLAKLRLFFDAKNDNALRDAGVESSKASCNPVYPSSKAEFAFSQDLSSVQTSQTQLVKSSALLECSELSRNGSNKKRALPMKTTQRSTHRSVISRVSPESSNERLERTLFIGNLPVAECFKPEEVYRHLGLEKAIVESFRLRSVPVDQAFRNCPRAGIARKALHRSCDYQNAYVVLKDSSVIRELLLKQIDPFRGRDLRLDFAARNGFSLFDRKRSVCVGGLPRELTEKGLKEALSAFGDVLDCRIVRDRVSRDSKGIGFVCFGDRGSATKAILQATSTIMGRNVRLMRALSEAEVTTRSAGKAQQRGISGPRVFTPALRRIFSRKNGKVEKRKLAPVETPQGQQEAGSPHAGQRRRPETSKAGERPIRRIQKRFQNQVRSSTKHSKMKSRKP